MKVQDLILTRASLELFLVLGSRDNLICTCQTLLLVIVCVFAPRRVDSRLRRAPAL